MISFSEIKRKAQELSENFIFGYPEPINIYGIARSYFNFRISEAYLPSCSARLIYCNENGLIVINENEKYEGRKRFAIAHEIGHYLLHFSNDNYIKNCNNDDLDNWHLKGNNIEIEANCFASELLLPSKFVEIDCNKKINFEVIQNLAKKFKTSLTATAYKCVEVSEDKPCALVFSKDGIIKWFKFSVDLEEHHEKFFIKSHSELYSATEAYKFFRNQKYETFKTTYVSCWFSNKNIDDEYYIEEHTFVMNNLNAVLTLLVLGDYS